MPDSRYMTKACSECQQNFKTSRGHAKYCSARCRMRAMRRKGRVTVTKVDSELSGLNLDFLAWIASTELSQNTPEDWQN